MSTLPYQRILLKLSGEALMGSQPFGINPAASQTLARAIQALHREGVAIGIVIGGGNIFRGKSLEALGLERAQADQMGMLATLMNGIALQQALSAAGCPSKVLSALDCPRAVDSFSQRSAMQALQEGNVVIFVGGTGNPYFTTDTAAALRASEIKANVLLKATKVDGVYNKDPVKYPDAVKYDTLTYEQALAENLKVMDATSIALCRSNSLPILVFNMNLLQEEKVVAALSQKNPGTLVKGESKS